MNDNKKIDLKEFDVNDVFDFIKKTSKCKFIESIDAAINLSINTKDSDQNISSGLMYPNIVVKKNRKIIVFAPDILHNIAYKSGAYIVGTNDLFDKVKNRSINYDVVLSVPESINIVSKLGFILGPKNLMPNLKLGTLTNDLEKSITDFVNGKIIYRNDKFGIVHVIIGKVNFTNIQLIDNLKFLISSINFNKPNKFNKSLINKITLSSTMGKSYKINLSSLNIGN